MHEGNSDRPHLPVVAQFAGKGKPCFWCCRHCESNSHSPTYARRRGKATRFGCHDCYVAWLKATAISEGRSFDEKDLTFDEQTAVIYLCHDKDRFCFSEFHQAAAELPKLSCISRDKDSSSNIH